MEKDRISEFLESIDSEKWNCVYQANGMTLLTTKEYNYRYEERINLQTQLKKQQENEDLKRQLEYIRSGEYLNQLKFERNMLEDVVSNGEVSKEDKEFIDCTHRNTELLEENQKYKEVINKAIEFINECMRDEDDDTDIDIVTSLLAYEVDELLDILKGVER